MDVEARFIGRASKSAGVTQEFFFAMQANTGNLHNPWDPLPTFDFHKRAETSLQYVSLAIHFICRSGSLQLERTLWRYIVEFSLLVKYFSYLNFVDDQVFLTQDLYD